MTVRAVIVRTSLALFTLLLSTATAVACSCMGNRARCQSFWEANAVFSGQVISINIESEGDRYGRQRRVVRLFVKESFRGVSVPEVEVITGLGGGDCGFGFQIGKDYLVYAYERETDHKLETGICTRTSSLAKALQDITYIKGLPAARPGSTISGEIQRPIPRADTPPELSAMADVRVLVEGADKQYEAVSDEKGKFSVSGLPAGNYKITLVLPKGLTEGQEAQQVELANKGCASVSFFVVSDGRLLGRVFDAAGQPFEKAEITIMEFGKAKYQGYSNTVYSDKEGNYEFTRVPPGRYIVQIRFDGLTSQQSSFPPVYHPNTSDPSQANVIEIGEGKRIEKFDIYLPTLPREYRVEGVVVRPDGQSASGAVVEYSASEGIGYQAKVDSRGEFFIKAYEGVTLSIRAALERNGKQFYSDWVKVNAATTLKLVVPGF